MMYPGFVVRGKTKNAMIEGGFNLMGPLYLSQVTGDTGR